MNKITIKIIEIDQETQSIIVRYVSENSRKDIDEYPAISFQITNFDAATPEEFVNAIRPQITQYVQQRDQSENPRENIDLSSWAGYSAEVEPYIFEPSTPADPAAPPINALANPEVIL